MAQTFLSVGMKMKLLQLISRNKKKIIIFLSVFVVLISSASFVLSKTLFKDYSLDNISEVCGALPEYRMHGDGHLKTFYGKYSNIIVSNSWTAKLTFLNVKTLTGIQNPLKDLVLVDSSHHEYGSIYRFEQRYKGLEVYSSIFTVSVGTDGFTDSLLSDYTPIPRNMSVKPKISFDEANKAVEKFSDEITAWYLLDGEKKVKDRLLIYGDSDGAHLVWCVYFYDGRDDTVYKGFIDAKNGELLFLK